MTPFFEEFYKSLKKRGLSPAISEQAKALASQTGDWFFQYGQQAAGDRQTVTRLEQRIKSLEAKLLKEEA